MDVLLFISLAVIIGLNMLFKKYSESVIYPPFILIGLCFGWLSFHLFGWIGLVTYGILVFLAWFVYRADQEPSDY